MKKILLILLIALLTNHCFSQAKETLVTPKWTFGIYAAPVDFTYLYPLGGNHWVRFKPGGELGISVFKRLYKRIYLRTGIVMAKRRFMDETRNYKGGSNLNEYSDSIFYTHHNWTDLNIPIDLNFRFPITKKFSVSSSLGTTLGWVLRNKVTIKTNYSSIQSTYNADWNRKGVDKIYIGIGLGGIYNINEKFSLMLEPHVMYDFKRNNLYNTATWNLRATLIYNLPLF